MSRGVPRRGGGSRRWLFVVLVVVTAAGAATALPAASFSTASVPRDTNANVVTDTNAVVGLDKTTSVRQKKVDRLVTITNNFGRPADVTVSLVENADGNLYVDTDGDGTVENVENSYRFEGLASGETVDVCVEAAGGTKGELLEYDLNGEHLETTFDMRRDADIGSGNGPDGCST
ncbi:hypothetical protein BRD04_10555 [Halobacteriales archaeon QS_9_67_17]|nr:MAG: hypothetical protein BRD04_10555 [Halobacteriales archaeon QS_9_67_17]